jgi:hypothetical protein
VHNTVGLAIPVGSNPFRVLVPSEREVVLRLLCLEAVRGGYLGRPGQAGAATQPPIGKPLCESLDLRIESNVFRVVHLGVRPRRIVRPGAAGDRTTSHN